MELIILTPRQMQIERKRCIKYWAGAPKMEYGFDGFFMRDCYRYHFPDVRTLSEKERKILRPVLMQHPEYLLEISLFSQERIQ